MMVKCSSTSIGILIYPINNYTWYENTIILDFPRIFRHAEVGEEVLLLYIPTFI